MNPAFCPLPWNTARRLATPMMNRNAVCGVALRRQRYSLERPSLCVNCSILRWSNFVFLVVAIEERDKRVIKGLSLVLRSATLLVSGV